MIGENFCWLFLCGTDAGEIFTTCYGWDLLIDGFVVVAACSIINRSFFWNLIDATNGTSEDSEHSQQYDSMGIVNTFATFSLLYFSIINSWYWYVHQYASRFVVASASFRVPMLLLTLFLIGMVFGSLIPSILVEENAGSNLLSLPSREFSIAMILERVALFAMFLSVAVPLPRTRPLCALLCFVLGNSILCYSFASIEQTVASQLWVVVVIMELMVDFFLVVALHNARRLWVPYNLQSTMNRSCVVAFAPMGATIVSLFTSANIDTTDVPVEDFSRRSIVATNSTMLIVSALLLQALFGFLYSHLQAEACSHLIHSQRQQQDHQSTPIHRLQHAILLLVSKLLGWSLWAVGATLVGSIFHPISSLLPPISSSSSTPMGRDESDILLLLLGWSVGCSMILLFCLRLLAGRMYDLREVAWVLACWLPFAVVFVELDMFTSIGAAANEDQEMTHADGSNDPVEEENEDRSLNRQLMSLSLHLLVVSLVNVMESFDSLQSFSASATLDPIVVAAVAATSGNPSTSSLVGNYAPLAYSEREELINNQTSTIIYI